ncbi:MAG: class I SAM-dependent methyltransferase [Deltaproteobacteria bacterium]|nr:MAG: class I SAM-dependent methyltransferase [Deltaproteobacteria bacterium]
MSEGVAFTGERLHEGSDLFAVDLARHRAAYEFARGRTSGGRVLDFGSGSGYGAAGLAGGDALVVGVDRVAPDARNRGPAHFLRADLRDSPLADGAFDLVVSFQVIEHLADPSDYLDAIAGALAPEGTALITTPNRQTSDGENPFHVREYLAAELAELLRTRFAEVEVLGIGATGDVARYYAARLERIRRIVKLDPLRLRRRLPRALVEWLFGRLAIVVRSRIRSDEGLPAATWRDFPVGPADDACLDLLAVCRAPRATRRAGS